MMRQVWGQARKSICRSGPARSMASWRHNCGQAGDQHSPNREQSMGLSLNGLLAQWQKCGWMPQLRLISVMEVCSAFRVPMLPTCFNSDSSFQTRKQTDDLITKLVSLTLHAFAQLELLGVPLLLCWRVILCAREATGVF